jgi:hypothetical protein
MQSLEQCPRKVAHGLLHSEIAQPCRLVLVQQDTRVRKVAYDAVLVFHPVELGRGRLPAPLWVSSKPRDEDNAAQRWCELRALRVFCLFASHLLYVRRLRGTLLGPDPGNSLSHVFVALFPLLLGATSGRPALCRRAIERLSTLQP